MSAPTTAPTGGAPIGRLLGAELRWVLRRPRTLVMLGLFALLPVVMAIGIAIADGGGRGPGLVQAVVGNGLVLPIAAITLALALLLPLAVAMAAADAIAGEAAHGTLRGLLLSPVGRLRLVGMKAFGVFVVALLAVCAIAVLGVVAGLVIVGGADGQLVTLSGTVVGLGEALLRVLLVVAWTLGQVAAVGAIALAVSAYTEHPLVVVTSVLGGMILMGLAGAIPALDWLQPWLLISGWSAAVDVLRDPMPLGGLIDSTLKAACYLAVGAGVTIHRMLGRDA